MAKLVFHRDAVPVAALTAANKAGLKPLQAVKVWRAAWDAVRANPQSSAQQIAEKVRQSGAVPKAIDWATILPVILQIVQMIMSFFGK